MSITTTDDGLSQDDAPFSEHIPSGVAVFDAAAEDVAQMVTDLHYPDLVEFRRVAVTPEQAETYQLPTAPRKDTDKRGDWTGENGASRGARPRDARRHHQGSRPGLDGT